MNALSVQSAGIISKGASGAGQAKAKSKGMSAAALLQHYGAASGEVRIRREVRRVQADGQEVVMVSGGTPAACIHSLGFFFNQTKHPSIELHTKDNVILVLVAKGLFFQGRE